MDTSAVSPDDARKNFRRLRLCLILAAGFTTLLWLIKVFEVISGSSLVEYGIYPGSINGLSGILLAPLIHSSYSHLFANTGPLLILGTLLLYGYPRSARIVIPSIYLGVGLSVWLFGREAWHIGASGLVFGLMFFVFCIGVIRRDKRAIALSLVVFFLYGGMIAGIFPSRPEISFESHLAGAVFGVVLAIVFRNIDPRPPVKKYSWEYEDDPEPGEGNDFEDASEIK